MELHVLSSATAASAQNLSIRNTEQVNNPKGDNSISEVPIDETTTVQRSTEVSVPELGEETRRSQHRSREYIQLAALYFCLFRMHALSNNFNLFTEIVR